MVVNLPRVPQTLDYSCGAACFESMYLFLRKTSLGELYIAQQLGTLDLGYTLPERVAQLAMDYQFHTELKENAEINDIKMALERGDVIFVTWWYEDSGHYSLVKEINEHQMILMDPWEAREDKDQHIKTDDFDVHWKARGAVMILVREYDQFKGNSIPVKRPED